MKLTDLAIVFQLFFICLLTVVHTKGSFIHSEMMAETMYNNVMDGIVEDALRAGFVGVDHNGEPIVDLDAVKICFQGEHSLYGSEDRQILIYVDQKNFYLWDSDASTSWNESIAFSQGDMTPHEVKIQQLTAYLEQIYDISLHIPTNDGENWVNTVEPYSLLAISINRNSCISCFSGAKIH